MPQEDAIAGLGFAGGGEERNYEHHEFEWDALRLANLLESALRAAFDEPYDVEIGVYFKRRSALSDLLAALKRSCLSQEREPAA